MCHRDGDQPAVISADGSHHWYRYGKKHRIGKPAAIFPNGNQFWYLNGKPHRLDGPSCTGPSVRTKYNVNGKEVTAAYFPEAVANWVSYQEVTRADIQMLLGSNFRIVPY